MNQLQMKRSFAAIVAAETRRLYNFENNCKILKPLCKRMALDDINYHSKRIWKKVFNHRGLTNYPEIIFGRGAKCKNGTFISYYEPNHHRVVLAKGQREMLTASHELIHANGRDYHDIEFIFQEFKIFGEYFDIPLQDLSLEAEKYNLSYQPFIF